MRELQDLYDLFPIGLLVALPIMIILSPAVDAVGYEFPAHRLAQYELGGVARGSKMAAISMDARPMPKTGSVSNLLRKVVVAKIQDVSPGSLNEALTNGAGGILLILPNFMDQLDDVLREKIAAVEEYLSTTEFEIPVYFAHESEQLMELLDNLNEDGSGSSESATKALFTGISSYGYQLVSSVTSVPKVMANPFMASVEAVLRGGSGDDGQSTIVVVTHYDAKSPAPSLSFGAESNGAGVGVALELARLFGKLYSNPRTRPPLNLVILLSAGGKLNYFGTKKWLEHHLDHDARSELLADVAFVACLDTISGSKLSVHVSKPPKDDTSAGQFLANIKPDNLVHKKINLADEMLAWEHERFSIRRIPAFTLSGLDIRNDASGFADVRVDPESVVATTKRIAESLACMLYQKAPAGCEGHVFEASLEPSFDSIDSWLNHLASTPRFPSLTASKADPFVTSLVDAVKSYVGSANVKLMQAKRETHEPEFVLYEEPKVTITAFRVKPAVFDLFLTACIAAYLGLVYVMVSKAGLIVGLITTTSGLSSKANGHANGNGYKMK